MAMRSFNFTNSFDGCGAFGFGAENQDGLAEGGGFFLDAAGIGDDQLGAAHEVHERDVGQGIEQRDVGDAGESVVL